MLRDGCATRPAVCGSATGCGDGASCATPVAGAEAAAFGAGALAVDGYTGSMLALPGSTAIPGLRTAPASWHGLPFKQRQNRHACTSVISKPVSGCDIESMLSFQLRASPGPVAECGSSVTVPVACSTTGALRPASASGAPETCTEEQ